MALLKLVLVAATAAAAVTRGSRTAPLEARSSTCVDTCGSNCYWQSDIDAAVQQGCSDLSSGNDPDSYPHQYNDYEGFTFPDSGPYYEFPIMSNYQVYTGGSPGADRVIFTSDCTFQGAITHTGASSEDGFVQCQSD